VSSVTEYRPSRWWVLSDYFEMVKRNLRHIANDPEQLVTVTLQPVLTLAIMDFFLGGAIQAGTRQNYLDFVLPGIFIVMAGFAAVTTALGVASDMLQGVVDRFRSPAGAGAWAAAIGMTLLAASALSWIAAVIGLLGKSVEVVQQVAALVIIPVFLSSALVPTGTMPAWLRVVAANQPLSQAIDCIRALLAGAPPGDRLWLALAELAGIIAIAFALQTVLFKRKT
jgi:ABC-2 type transport system permease protein